MDENNQEIQETEVILTQKAVEQLIENIKNADNDILQDAKTYAEGLGSRYDPTGAATEAENAAKAYANSHCDPTGAATEAENAAKDYADGLASHYATAAQGTLAESAIQKIVTGTTNGTILVDNSPVSVYGLGSAAYTDISAYDIAGAATAAQAASEPKKITGVVKIDFTDVQPTNDIYTVNNINQRFANLADAQSGSVDGERLVETSQNFSEKTIIVSPASDADWILWQEYGIRCSGQSNITENEDSLTGGLSFSSSDKPDVPTYANIIILY